MVGRDRAPECDMAASEAEIPDSGGALVSLTDDTHNHSGPDTPLFRSASVEARLYHSLAKILGNRGCTAKA